VGRERTTPAAAAGGAVRRWTRRLLWICAAAVVARVALWATAPWILERAAAAAGYRARLDALDLSILGGRVELRRLDLDLLDAEAERPLLHVEYATVDLDVSALATGRLLVHRVEVDGVDVALQRDRDGAWNFAPPPSDAAREPREGEPEPAADAPPSADEEPRGAPDFSLPFQVDALRLQHVSVDLVDAVSGTEAGLDASLRVSDLGSKQRPTRLELRVGSPGALDGLRLDARGSGALGRLDGELVLDLAGLQPGAIAPLLEPLGVVPHAEAVDFHLATSVRLEPVDELASACSGELRLEALALEHDGRRAVGLETLRDAVERWTGTELSARAEVDGLRAELERDARGALRAAGFELAGAPSTGDAEAADVPEPPRAASPLALELAAVAVRDAVLVLRDAAVVPASTVEVALDELTLGPLSTDPTRAAEAVPLAARLRVPGAVESVALDGSARPFGAERTLELALAVEGIAPERLAPQLALLGLESTFEEGSLSLALEASSASDPDGSLRHALALTGIRLADGAELFGVDRIELAATQAAGSASSGPSIDAIEVAGLRASAVRRASGAVEALGVRTLAGTAPAAAEARAPAGAASPSSPEDARLPALDVGRLTVRDVRLSLLDEGVQPPVELELDDVGLELVGLTARPDAPPATLRASLRVDDVLEALTVEGSLAASAEPRALDAALDLRLEGLASARVAAYLAAAGIGGELVDGDLEASLEARVAQGDGALDAELAVRGLELRDAGVRLAAAEELAVRGARVGGDGLRVASVELRAPRLAAVRDADGIGIGSLRLQPMPPASAGPQALAIRPQALATRPQALATRPQALATRPQALATRPQALATGPQALEIGPDSPAAGQEPGAAAPSRLALGALVVEDARLDWSDAALDPPLATEVVVDARIDDLDTGADTPPATFLLELAADAPGEASASPETLRVEGRVELGGGAVALNAALDARGLDGSAWERYLPAGTDVDLAAGSLRLEAEAEVGPAGEGVGHAARLAVRDVRLAEEDEDEPRFELAELALDLPRIDPAGGAIRIEELRVTGTGLAVERGADGAWRALGLRFGAAPAAPRRTGPAPLPARPATAAAAPARPTTGALPRIELGRLDLELERLRVVDATQPAGAAPLEGRLRLFAPDEQVLLDDVTDDLEPLALRVEGAFEPVVGELAVDLELAPFAPDPEVGLELTLAGLRGQGITELLPGLAAELDGSGLEAGELRARARGILHARRRGPLDFAFPRGFGFELLLEDVELVDGPGGERLAGLEALRVEALKVDPATGDVHLRWVEVDGTFARAAQRADGLHALGLVLRPGPEDARADGDAAPAAAAPESAPAAGPAPVVRVDNLLLSGLDVEWRDESVDPPTIVPLRGLDAQLDGFSTRALSEPLPLRFSAYLDAGEVPLPERVRSANLLGGIASAAMSAIGTRRGPVEIESRPLFLELALSGRMVLAPRPEGWANLRLVGLELLGFRGTAGAAGVEIGDGLLDADVRLRFEGAAGADVDAVMTFDHLLLDEPPDGPIRRYLRLPAPLDAVLFALKDDAGQHVIPLGFRLKGSQLSAAGVGGAVTTALAKVVTNALASAPLRVTGVLTDLVGLTGKDEGAAPVETVHRVAFAPADATLLDAERGRLAPVIERLRRDRSLTVVLRHELGPGDLTRSEQLANPSLADCRDLAQRLAQKRAELVRRRDALAADARVSYATGDTERAERSRARLTALDREVGLTEDALDRVYELLRPGAERRREQRTRAACLTVAELRTSAVRVALLESDVDGLAERIDVRQARFRPIEAEEGQDPSAGGGVLVVLREED